MRRWLVLGLLAAAAVVGCGGDDGSSADGSTADLAVPWIDPDGTGH